MRNRIIGYGVSDMKNLISVLSGGFEVAYLGVTGISVTEEANKQAKVPLGVSVQEVEEESPALRAGIQKGDIIVEIDGKTVASYEDFATVFSQKKASQMMELKILRQSGNEYIEMTFNIVLGAAN
jgi:serine protease Do